MRPLRRQPRLQILQQPLRRGPQRAAALMGGVDRDDARLEAGIADRELDQPAAGQIGLGEMGRDGGPAGAGEQEIQPRAHVDKAPDPRADHAVAGAAGIGRVGQDVAAGLNLT